MRTGLAALVAATALLAAPSALAHGGDGDEGTKATSGSGDGAVTTADDDRPKGPEHLYIALDWVLGFGKGTAVEQQTQTSLKVLQSNVVVAAPFRTQTFMLVGHYAFKSFGLGVRFPMTIGDFADAASNIRGENVFTNGGLELAIDLPVKLSEAFKLIPQLGLVAPFAQGDPIPSDVNGAQFNKQGTYAYSANLAAAAAHGYEDDELYWPGRVGIVPKVSAELKASVLTLTPYVKVPILIDTHVDSAERLRLEGVGGLRVAIAATSWFEPAVRVWAMLPLAAQSGFRDPVAVVEPSLRFHSGNTISLMVGGVLPFAGALMDPYVAGVRATLLAAF